MVAEEGYGAVSRIFRTEDVEDIIAGGEDESILPVIPQRFETFEEYRKTFVPLVVSKMN